VAVALTFDELLATLATCPIINGAIVVLAGHPVLLAIAVVIDLIVGDPVYGLHPVRLMGRSLTAFEGLLRRIGLDGYGGGILLFLLLGLLWVGGISTLVATGAWIAPWVSWALHLYFLYSLLALGDLLRHVWRVERAVMQADLDAARAAVSCLVGRDTNVMDAGACRRAAIESLSERFPDCVVSALFWYAILGLPGLVLFKVVSTMDSMVGYKTPRYLRFGWCGARSDDVMNYAPARIAWLLVTIVAAVWPGASAAKAWRVGLRQHGVLPGPNAGWSEAATAGAIQRRLVGPIYLRGQLVTEIWLGDPSDPPAETRDDVIRAIGVITIAAIVATAIACLALSYAR
jgi:adenosylcobinamide-phosphate synthase